MPYAVKSLTVCDDVRQEASGKQTLVGVYLKSVVVQTVPVRVLQMMFRVVVDTMHENHKRATFAVKGEDGHTLIEAAAEANVPDTDEDVVFVFGQQNVVLPKAQRYDVTFALDGTSQKIGEFNVRLAKNETETEALAKAS